METINAYQLGRAGASVAKELGYNAGFKDGVNSVLTRVSKWLDSDTIQELKEEYELTKTH